MSSIVPGISPSRRYSNALDRLELGEGRSDAFVEHGLSNQCLQISARTAHGVIRMIRRNGDVVANAR